MLKLYLVRHGESAWNQLQLYTGQKDVPLSEQKRMQAERLAERLSQTPLQAIYTSPLQRAQGTAQPIAQSRALTVRLEARLAEIHHGAWEGNPTTLVREQYADAYRAWRTQPHTVKMPEGESLDEVARRAADFLQDLFVEHSDGNILIVSHDAVLRVIVLKVLNMGLEYFWRWRFDNASVSIVEQVKVEGVEPGFVPNSHDFRLALLNDVHHLEVLASSCDAQAL